MAEPMSPEELAAALKTVGKWREGLTYKQFRTLESAGLMSLRAWGLGLAEFEAIDPIDGELAPQTMDDAFALLRRLVDRTDLSPMGVVHAFTAGSLAGSILTAEFPALLAHRVEGHAAFAAGQEAAHG